MREALWLCLSTWLLVIGGIALKPEIAEAAPPARWIAIEAPAPSADSDQLITLAPGARWTSPVLLPRADRWVRVKAGVVHGEALLATPLLDAPLLLIERWEYFGDSPMEPWTLTVSCPAAATEPVTFSVQVRWVSPTH